jgi:hypothetical protein
MSKFRLEFRDTSVLRDSVIPAKAGTQWVTGEQAGFPFSPE